MKYNTEIVKEIFMNKGYKPLFTQYHNSMEKLDFMNEDGYKGSISLNKINNIDNYLYFSVFNPFTIENINLYCEKNNLLCRIYDQEYKGNDNYLKSKCLVCKKDFYTTWHIIASKRYNKYRKCCKECSNKFIHDNDMKKYNIEDVKEILLKYGLKLLNNEYINNSTRMNCIDKLGYKGKVSLHQLLNGVKFCKFHKANPYSIYNVNVYLKNKNVGTIILDNEYKGNRYLYNFKCECGRKFLRSIDSVVYNNSLYCSECVKWRKSTYHLKVKDYLENNKIKYIEEKTFEKCKDKNYLPFDFYLPDYNVCIEVQGEQHYMAKDCFGGIEGFKKTASHDIMKAYFCRNNNLKLIIIKYDNFFNNNYIDILNTLLR